MDNEQQNNDRANNGQTQEDVPYYEYAPPKQNMPDAESAAPTYPVEQNVPATPPASGANMAGMGYAGEHTVPTIPASEAQWQPARRRRDKRWWLYAGLAGLVAVLVIAAGVYALFFYNKQAPTTSVASPYHTAACPFKPDASMVEGKGLQCGFLSVAEDRSNAHSKMIQLAVAVYKAPAGSSNTTPELYLTGGPGGAALSDLGTYITQANLNKITLGHDFILLDQRGTGFSKPSLNCHEMFDQQIATLNKNDDRATQNRQYIQAAQACHDRLSKAGVQLDAYTTIANATDVHDLIHALGYQQINLYGVSYGTRLALTVMRLFPHDLRSVILDSTVPTQNNLFTNFPSVSQHAYDVLFKGCASSPTCSAAYPQLDNTFYKLVSDLNTKPITFQDATYGPILLNGDNMANWVYSALYATSFIPYLPLIITQTSKGDYKYLSRLYSTLMIRNDISYGMYYSVECGEDMAFTNIQALTTAANVVHPEIQPSTLAGLQSDFGVCQIWGDKAVPAVQKQPVVSSLPTLILSGEYDPITPLTNAQAAMQTLSKSYLFVFPGTGHGVFLTNQCPDTIIATFLDNPAAKPAGTCLNTATEPDFQ